MGYFDTTLFLFKEEKQALSFLPNFHQQLVSLNITPELEEGTIIVFNDLRSGEEMDYIELESDISESELLQLLCSWKGLGLLSYRHPDFSFPFSINYLSWDDSRIQGFDIGFYSGEFKNSESSEKQQKMIKSIMELDDFEAVVGDIGNSSVDYINLRLPLSEIKELILQEGNKILR
jgi:hypothetical protein